MTHNHPDPRRFASRQGALAAVALASVMFLAACNGASTSPAGTATATTASSATSSASVAATPSEEPTASSAPSAETAVKELVKNFPSAVLPLMKDSQVQSSSLERGGTLAAASLTATITAEAAAVLEHYTTVFTDQGFAAQPGDSVDGVPMKTFVRADGQEIVTVSIVQTGSTATYTLGATLLPGSLK